MPNLKNFNDMAADKRWVNTMGALDGLRQELKSLAPRPDQKGQSMAVSGSDRQHGGLNGNNDGMLGSMLLEGMLGFAFGSAVSDALGMSSAAAAMPWGNTVELYDEYNRSSEKDRTNGQTNGEYELGERNVISHGFNMSGRKKIAKTADAMEWDSYMRDLPARRVLEQSMHGLNRQLDQMEAAQFRKVRAMALAM